MKEQLKYLRKHLGFNQGEMGEKINLSQTHISSLENGAREITDRIISDICREFNVNEDWLRTGAGEMFIQADSFSLDEYAQKKNLSELDTKILKSYMELAPDQRNQVMEMMKVMYPQLRDENSATVDNDINEEVESYRRELETEQKRATLSASEEPKGKSV